MAGSHRRPQRSEGCDEGTPSCAPELVSNLASEETRLKEQGVEFIMSATKEPGFGTIVTFRDPDGNYCQFMELEG